MTIKAEILKDSIFNNGKRVTTWKLHYPRFIHSELMTHRAGSKNSASSRAIPFPKMIKMILKDMAKPEVWGANQSGMQAKSELSKTRKFLAQTAWHASGYVAVGMAKLLYATGVHKQIVNRVVEPWSHMTVIMTMSDHSNFFELRAHPDAQPEFQILAYQMKDIYEKSIPNPIRAGEWHMPYIGYTEFTFLLKYLEEKGIIKPEEVNNTLMAETRIQEYLLKISAARCARVSYLTQDGRRSEVDEDIKLFNRLVGSKPLHASPIEHQCRQALPGEEGLGGNLGEGIVQFRKIWEKNEFTKREAIENVLP